MSYQETLQNFGNAKFLPEGWYWLIKSSEVKTGTAKPAKLADKDFVVYRGADNTIRIMDAHCPHMGAHLCDGFVEGNDIRCPFHYWKFNDTGDCIEIPAQKEIKNIQQLKTYPQREKYGLIWVWAGDPDKIEEVPVIPELVGKELDYSLGSRFIKNCHPNVVMINAIDAQHFKSVHNLVVDLDMKPTVLTPRCIQLSNTTPLPHKNIFLKWASKFYKNALTYEMTYWWGHVGSVMVGPDFLHFYIIFALRPTADGVTEGQTILVTEKRKYGWLLNPIILFLTKLVGNYFAKGDTIIFSRIKFNFKTPLKADKSIIHFIEHYEGQAEAGSWSNT
ncbi:aromatic ring-hydroxylating dioxygenase subunit alpha [Bacteriovorax sp. PP10]|uniref:Aromatic ring-hydroxylating dioxygenase subunit alpha n=1 Tax=Bacteriovorax antarcticus TaxID=3088717 RepID=A0ABU5VVA9_9BACT|nr:aromatic ring-hydroxylating dioxygenase subunit alpha [Bacteriovorax sp. PP10]MEA9356996.1 aromatic ring-hydroxylating dioxygenase subunit alpha [Bacteriovorax sp. PP10]